MREDATQTYLHSETFEMDQRKGERRVGCIKRTGRSGKKDKASRGVVAKVLLDERGEASWPHMRVVSGGLISEGP